MYAQLGDEFITKRFYMGLIDDMNVILTIMLTGVTMILPKVQIGVLRYLMVFHGPICVPLRCFCALGTQKTTIRHF